MNDLSEKGYGSLSIKLEFNGMKIDALNRRIEEVDERLIGKFDELREELSAGIERVAADLAAHRAEVVRHPGDSKNMEMQKVE